MNYLSTAKLSHELMFLLHFPYAVISHLRDKVSLVPGSFPHSRAQQTPAFMANQCPNKADDWQQMNLALWDSMCQHLPFPSVGSLLPAAPRLWGSGVLPLTTSLSQLMTMNRGTALRQRLAGSIHETKKIWSHSDIRLEGEKESYNLALKPGIPGNALSCKQGQIILNPPAPS